MAKKKPQLKRRSARPVGSKKGTRKKSAKPKLTLKQRLARARKLEVLDAGKPVLEVSRKRALESQPQTRGAPSAVISDSVGRWEKTRAISRRMWKRCNAFCKRRRKNYKLLSWTQKALMEKLRSRPGIRTRLLPSKLFRAVLIFQLME